MRKLTIIAAILLIAGHIMTELHGFAFRLWPEINSLKVDLFWSSTYHNKEVSVQWYIKMLLDDFLYVILLFVMAKIALEYSVKLYLICIIYMLYHVADILNFMYNYKQSWNNYLALLYFSTAATVILILPAREKMHLVK